jgi:hypothetical protein
MGSLFVGVVAILVENYLLLFTSLLKKTNFGGRDLFFSKPLWIRIVPQEDDVMNQDSIKQNRYFHKKVYYSLYLITCRV